MTIKEYTEDAVHKYLRTVLFVDDQLYPQAPITITEQDKKVLDVLVPPPETGNEVKVAEQTGNARTGQQAGTDTMQEINPKDIVDGFAQHGIVCGLYQPDTNLFTDGNMPEKLVTLCDHADVFIMDWYLKGKKPESPVPKLIHELIQKDKDGAPPKTIRFCAIYTLESITTVLTKLRDELISLDSNLKITIDEKVKKLQLEGITIRIYGKPTIPKKQTASSKSDVQEDQTFDSKPIAKEEESIIAPNQLANYIIKDFTSEYEGIMSATALRGIADVRDNAKRILDKFPSVLDYALMVHAGLTVDAPTAPEDLQDLLGDEIHSILSGNRVSDEDM